jgi:tRNA dimethylallyltransferase
MEAIFLLGPTASGKSSLALNLADQLQGKRNLEIISVDSALVYRGMDIGTAKPSAAERAQVPHHLIDLIDASEAYSAARFVSDATRLIHEIHQRGNFPLIVGGTMLYVKALKDGMHDLPASEPEVRAQLLIEAQSRGWPALHGQLAQVDPDTAARLPPNDAQRIGRALELFRQTGLTMSQWLAREAPGPSTQMKFSIVCLEPSRRAELHLRIEQRFHQMVKTGFVEEVRSLMERGDLNPGMASMRCVGYRQIWTWLAAGGHAPLSQVIEGGVIATRQLAKRQLTWLRAMPERHILDCLSPDLEAQILEHLKNRLLA